MEDTRYYASNVGHIQSQAVNIYGIMPNYFEVALDKYLIVDDRESTGLSLGEVCAHRVCVRVCQTHMCDTRLCGWAGGLPTS